MLAEVARFLETGNTSGTQGWLQTWAGDRARADRRDYPYRRRLCLSVPRIWCITEISFL